MPSEDHFRCLFERMDEGYCVIEVIFDESHKPVDYLFLECNPAFEKHTGIAGAVGRRMRAIAPAHEQHWFDTYGRIAVTGETLRFEHEAVALGRYYDVCAFRVGAPELRQVGILFSDIAPRKNAEEAVRRSREALIEADKRKDEFLATLAHELRNPLAPIRNALYLLKISPDADQNASKARDIMDRQLDLMVRLVDDLLEMSRITSGKIRLRTEKTDVAAVMLSAAETSRPVIEAAGHQLSLTLPPKSLTVQADPVRLAQVVANLLNNAAKYTDRGGHIGLSADEQGGQAVLRVSDDGIGIPPDMLETVFSLFTQVNRTYDRTQGGLGIGLTLVRRLVEMHGGTVEARSEGSGKGSEFVVMLPLADGSPPLPLGKDADSVEGLEKRRILVVDDNEDAAESLKLVLQLLGATVMSVHNGEAALDALNEWRPNVMLLDVGMPGMDGYEVAKRVRQKAQRRDVTLIAVTGWGQERDRQRSFEAGIDHHLVKPVDVYALQKLLATMQSVPNAVK